MPPTTVGLVVVALVPLVVGDWRVSLQTAIQLHQAGNLVGAAEHYREAIGSNPALAEHAPVLTNYGFAIQAEGQAAEAIEAFRGVLRLTPDSADTYFNIGRAHTDLGEHDAAQEALPSHIHI